MCLVHRLEMACATKVMKVIPLISFILSVTNIIIICVAIFKDYNFLFINTNGPKIIAVLLLILMFALFMCELCSFLLYCSFKNMQEICVHVHTTTWKLSCFTKAFLLVALFYLFNYMSPKPWSFVCRVVFLVSGILHLVLILVAEGAAKFSRQQISSPREAEEGD